MLRIKNARTNREFELASHVDYVDRRRIPIEGSNQFQRKAFEVVCSVARNESSDENVAKLARDCFPLVDFLTKPRSIDEFQDLKKVILNTLHKHGETHNIFTPYYWVTDFCMTFGIFPNTLELTYAGNGEKSLEDIWNMYEKPTYPRNGKVISFKEAKSVWKIAENEEVRLGLICGKFRLGKVHPGYQSMFLKAREALGNGGIFLAMLDSEHILKARYGDNLARIEPGLRLDQIAQSPGVDYASLTPGFEGMQPEDVHNYMNGVWRKLKPNFYFVGTRQDKLFPVFEEQSSLNGVILLWGKDGEVPSTSQVVRDLQGKI